MPELCHLAEETTDAHFRYHVVSALHFGLTQLKGAHLAAQAAAHPAPMPSLDDNADNETRGKDGKCNGPKNKARGPVVPVPALDETLLRRLLGICWANLEDPLTQTVRAVQGVFAELVAVQTTTLDGAGCASLFSSSCPARVPWRLRGTTYGWRYKQARVPGRGDGGSASAAVEAQGQVPAAGHVTTTHRRAHHAAAVPDCAARYSHRARGGDARLRGSRHCERAAATAAQGASRRGDGAHPARGVAHRSSTAALARILVRPLPTTASHPRAAFRYSLER